LLLGISNYSYYPIATKLLAGQGCWLGRVAGWAGLPAGQGCRLGRVAGWGGCWLGRVAGWAGLLAGQGCWLGRVGVLEADPCPGLAPLFPSTC